MARKEAQSHGTEGGRKWQFLHGNETFQDLESVDQVSNFGHPELLFWDLVNFRSSFRLLLEGVFL
jgi:hypothetical protein